MREGVCQHTDLGGLVHIVTGVDHIAVQVNEQQRRGGIFLFLKYLGLDKADHTAEHKEHQQQRNVALCNQQAFFAKGDDVINVHFIVIVVLIADVDVVAVGQLLLGGVLAVHFLCHKLYILSVLCAYEYSL